MGGAGHRALRDEKALLLHEVAVWGASSLLPELSTERPQQGFAAANVRLGHEWTLKRSIRISAVAVKADI
jgi:hypothetical protein